MDPHNFQTSLASNEYFNGAAIDLQLPQQLNNNPIQPGPRSYKSRKYRPCDFCRARQVRCSISSAPPCQLCISHGRSCTFVDRPKKKRRPNLAASNGDQSSGSTTSTCMLQHIIQPCKGRVHILREIRWLVCLWSYCSFATIWCLGGPA